jgi:ribosome maturation factor RimP
MDKDAIVEQLKEIVGVYLQSQGVELVDLIYRREGRNLILEILADLPEGGITIGECTRLNREISVILDERNILDESYVLGVSSPGLDRPLTAKNDFLRCRGKVAKFFLKEIVNGKVEWDGIIKRVENDMVFIDTEGMILEIPLLKINRAKQLLDV